VAGEKHFHPAIFAFLIVVLGREGVPNAAPSIPTHSDAAAI